MIQKLSTYAFEKRAKQYLSTSTRERRFANYASAKTILLLFESDYTEKNPVIRQLISTLQNDGKKVVAYGFVQKKEVTTAILPDFRILNLKDTVFLQKPSIGVTNTLEELTFDLLIDLTLRPIITMQYIALYANAACKTGWQKTDLSIYDFGIKINAPTTELDENETPQVAVDEEYLFNQIIFYLKSIQTND